VIGLSPDQVGEGEAPGDGHPQPLLGPTRLFLLTDAGQADPGNTTERWLERNAFRARNEFFPPWRVAAFGTTKDGMVSESLDARFGGRVRLRELRHSARASPGDTVAIMAMWERLRADDPVEELAWYAHLIGPDGQLVAQHDALIGGGYGWGPDDERLDRRGILVPPDAQPGVYRVRIGVYGSGGPLPAATPGGHQELTDDAVTFDVAIGP
jgi:hypothetical protein